MKGADRFFFGLFLTAITVLLSLILMVLEGK